MDSCAVAVCGGQCGDDIPAAPVLVGCAPGGPVTFLRGRSAVVNLDVQGIALGGAAEVQSDRGQGVFDGVGDEFGDDEQGLVGGVLVDAPCVEGSAGDASGVAG